jgi:uncharacterized damage-inducible protein DinB
MNRYQEMRRNLVETAEAMPEEHYTFRLTPEQRPFGEWIAHTAISNYGFCSGIRGESPPDTKHLRGLSGKAAIVKAIRESFEYCDAALKGMTDQKALSEVMIGTRKTYPVQGMITLLVSGSQHYGNLVGYLRSKGIVPPSTARGRLQPK